ncbi:DNA-binding CsgD family transcriptional regulator [Actinomadura viridis]|uniref:DNA-binding CsgD family transcriptional regulator n=1 Tax=Actinomadura viridis TaxID=58110 RepID=A0A931GMH2_9ACTN|nr:DNA-binding CsgD family transcriptional regulator [Actinomadura viridis]
MIADARDHRRSRALVLRGEAGIGKSALLEWAVGQGPWAGDGRAGGAERLLRATGFEAEEDIAFGGLNQVLWPVRARLDDLPGPQGAALRTALALPAATAGAGAGRGHDRFAAGLAVLTLLADLAEDGPVLCLVDDAQWLDTASAEALVFAARRLAAEGVVMLFAAREEGFAAGGGLEELWLGRLGRDDAERLLAQRDGVPATVRERIIHESEGNPLALIELCPPAAPEAGTTAPLPLADRVTATFRERIDRLPERTRLMLLLASAEGRGHLPTVLAAGAVLGAGLADLEDAERARLVEVTGSWIGFRHPLIRAAAYQGTVAARRLEAHRALAASATDPDCGVRHAAAAATAPDEDVAARLERSAERARDRTGYGTAARLYRQAADLSPERRGRARRLGAAATASLQAGRIEDARELAEAAGPDTADPAERNGLVRVRAAVEFECGDPLTAARMLVDHAALAGTGDDVQGMLRTGAAYAWMAGETSVLCRAARLLPSADKGVHGMARLVGGDYEAGLPLLNGLIEAARSGHGAGTGAPASGDDRMEAVQAVLAALIVGDDEGALELAAAEAAYCRRHGLAGALPNVLEVLARAQVAAGLHRDAEATVAEAADLARDTGAWRRAGRLGTVPARIAAIEGDRARLTALLEAAGGPPDAAAVAALGLLDLGLGRYEEALRGLEEITLHPHRHTADVMVAAADQIEAAVRAGRPDRARPPYERLRAWADAGGRPWAAAVALRSQALLSDSEDAAREPFEEALRLHEEAVRAAGQGGRPFEKARTELLYGEWLRRARRRSDARVPLRSALETFERLNAAPWAERARAELRATGGNGQPAPAHERALADDLPARLTPQELQVVRLAADGVSSREIAAQLFLSPRTVEYHLYKAYPKLGVASRKELSRLREELEPART